MNIHRVATFGLFFSFGLGVTAWISGLPGLKVAFGLGDVALGALLLVYGGCSIVMAYPNSVIVSRFGPKKVSYFSLTCSMVIQCMIPYVATHVDLTRRWPVSPVFPMCLLVGVLGSGFYTAFTVKASLLEQQLGYSCMSSFHAGFSLGAFMGSCLYSALLRFGHYDWYQAYPIHLVLAGVVTFVCVTLLPPDEMTGGSGSASDRALAIHRIVTDAHALELAPENTSFSPLSQNYYVAASLLSPQGGFDGEHYPPGDSIRNKAPIEHNGFPLALEQSAGRRPVHLRPDDYYESPSLKALNLGKVSQIGTSTLMESPHGMNSDSPGKKITGRSCCATVDTNVLRLAVISGFAMMAEATVGDWGGIYVLRECHGTFDQGPWLYAAFASAMIPMRLFGDYLVDGLGRKTVFRVGGLFAVIGYVMLIAFPKLHIALCSAFLIGTGVANNVPIIQTSAAKSERMTVPQVTATLSAFNSAAMLGGPSIIGPLSRAFGLRVAFCMPLAGLVVLVSGVRYLDVNKR